MADDQPPAILRAMQMLAQGLISTDAYSRIVNQFSGQQEKYADLRRSDNVEDRRKEHFQSLPQVKQKPNVFGDPTFGYEYGMTNLDPNEDFAPVPARNSLSQSLGSGVLDAARQKYLAERGN